MWKNLTPLQTAHTLASSGLTWVCAAYNICSISPHTDRLQKNHFNQINFCSFSHLFLLLYFYANSLGLSVDLIALTLKGVNDSIQAFIILHLREVEGWYFGLIFYVLLSISTSINCPYTCLHWCDLFQDAGIIFGFLYSIHNFYSCT